KLEQLIGLHHLSIKALAVQDEDFYRLFVNWLPFETTQGDMKLGEYKNQNPILRYVPQVDQFRQITRVAAAQGLCILNGGYTYDAELLAKYPEVFPETQAEVVDPASLTQTFDDLDLEEQEEVHHFLTMADIILQSFKCT